MSWKNKGQPHYPYGRKQVTAGKRGRKSEKDVIPANRGDRNREKKSRGAEVFSQIPGTVSKANEFIYSRGCHKGGPHGLTNRIEEHDENPDRIGYPRIGEILPDAHELL